MEYVGREMTACRKVPGKIFPSCLRHISVYQPCFYIGVSTMDKGWQHLHTHTDIFMHKRGPFERVTSHFLALPYLKGPGLGSARSHWRFLFCMKLNDKS